ncbi:hypothetical protein HETIRDRAFT_328879, partial [Heterobasidion irregulare TC 32-1]
FSRCSAQSRNRLGAIILHSPIASHSSTPAIEVVLVLCSALRAISSISTSLRTIGSLRSFRTLYWGGSSSTSLPPFLPCN